MDRDSEDVSTRGEGRSVFTERADRGSSCLVAL